MEYTRQVRIQHGLPIAFLHAHEEAVAGNAGVVDQDVDGAELFLYGVYHIGNGRVVGDVALHCDGFAALFFDEGQRFFSRRCIAGVYNGYLRAFRRKGDGNGPADTAGTARNDGSFIC